MVDIPENLATIVIGLVSISLVSILILQATDSISGNSSFDESSRSFQQAKSVINNFCSNAQAADTEVTIDIPDNGYLLIEDGNPPTISGESSGSQSSEIENYGPEELNECNSVNDVRLEITTERTLVKTGDTEGASIEIN